MKIQIGTISYRKKQTNEFETSKPLYAEETQELVHNQKILMQSACELYIGDLINYLNSKFSKTSHITTKEVSSE